MCRKHNDANVMSLGGRSTGAQFNRAHAVIMCSHPFATAGPEVAKQMVDVYLSTRWEGETNERHANRVVSFYFVVPPSPFVGLSCC